jgi:hypothetical protein
VATVAWTVAASLRARAAMLRRKNAVMEAALSARPGSAWNGIARGGNTAKATIAAPAVRTT